MYANAERLLLSEAKAGSSYARGAATKKISIPPARRRRRRQRSDGRTDGVRFAFAPGTNARAYTIKNQHALRFRYVVRLSLSRSLSLSLSVLSLCRPICMAWEVWFCETRLQRSAVFTPYILNTMPFGASCESAHKWLFAKYREQIGIEWFIVRCPAHSLMHYYIIRYEMYKDVL